MLEQCGFNISELGDTYNADHMQANGNIAMCGIDHIYTSKSLEGRLFVPIIKHSSDGQGQCSFYFLLLQFPCINLQLLFM